MKATESISMQNTFKFNLRNDVEKLDQFYGTIISLLFKMYVAISYVQNSIILSDIIFLI